jgi:hypothetical protein
MKTRNEFEDQETVLNGILIMNDVEYSITGKKESRPMKKKSLLSPVSMT